MKRNNLKYLRNLDNLTQEELANAMGVAKSTISMYETGNREPDNQTVQKLSDFFKVPTSFIRAEGVFSNFFEYESKIDYIIGEIENRIGKSSIPLEEPRAFIIFLNSIVEKINIDQFTNQIQIFLFFDHSSNKYPISTKPAPSSGDGFSEDDKRIAKKVSQLSDARKKQVEDYIAFLEQQDNQ